MKLRGGRTVPQDAQRVPESLALQKATQYVFRTAILNNLLPAER